MHKPTFGSMIGCGLALGLGAALVPARSHLPIGTPGLVLVIPVVAGVMTGGITAGLVSVAAGFAVFDFFFVPPYDSLTVGTSEDWITLAVFVLVMALVARVVAGLDVAREISGRREANARHLLELSELLLAERSTEELGPVIVGWVREVLHAEGAALLMSRGGHLAVVASSGTPISEHELERLRPGAHLPVALSTTTSEAPLQTLALTSSGRPIALLVLRDLPRDQVHREVMPILANHLAIALERAELRERIIHAELLEEVEHLRRSLIGAVSHDLRTPLATIKVASSTFLDKSHRLSDQDADELHTLIDVQADRLTRLVTSLLDMTRIQAGALEVRGSPQVMGDLVEEALGELRSLFAGREIEVAVPDDLPLVLADPLLIVQVLANLLDNANRYGPPGTAISVNAEPSANGRVWVSVRDHGPGVPAGEREAVFEKFARSDVSGRSGLGLAIAKAFVEAHGDHIWVEDAAGGGAKFVFTLPLVKAEET